MGDIKFVALPMDFISSRFNQRIINSYGYATIGRFMALMESLSKTDNEVNLSDREEWLNLMDLLRFKEDNEMQDFLDIIKASPDFNFVGNILSSRLVSETQERLEEKSVKARTNAQKRWKKCDGNATAMQPQCDGINEKCDRIEVVCDGNATAMQPQCDGINEKCDRIEVVCDGNADVCYNNTLQDNTLQDNTLQDNTLQDNTQQDKTKKDTTPHYNKPDDKTEVRYYTDKIIYNEDVRKFRNKRFVELATKLPPDEVSQLINAESERLFVLREEAA